MTIGTSKTTLKVGKNLLIVAIVLFSILSLSLVQNLRQSSCSSQNEGINPSDNWFVSPSTSSARILWQRKLTVSDSVFSVNSDTLVFFRGGNSDLCIKDNQLIALNSTMGEKVWSMPAKLVRSMIPLSDGYLVGACCTYVFRIDNDGNQLWQSQEFATKDFEPKLFVDQNSLFFAAGIGLFTLSLEDGTLLEQSRDGRIVGIFEGYQIIDTSFELQIIDISEGEISWVIPLETQLGSSFGQLLYSNGVLILVSKNDHLVAFDIETGDRQWELEDSFIGKPIIANDKLIAYGSKNSITTYDLSNGNILSEIVLESKMATDEVTLVDQNQNILLLSSEGLVYVFFTASAELVAIEYK